MKFRSIIWIAVIILVIGNGFLLYLFGGTPASILPDQELREQSENQRQQFESVSFWQRLLSGGGVLNPSLKPSQFDGLEIEENIQEEVVSVMIDNFSLARPQHSGIRSASIVYEALVEGGITRLMLIMPYQNLEQVGPIRSARDYFVDFAEEYGGIYVHHGGSPIAMEQLFASTRVLNLQEDEAEVGDTYSFRDEVYDAPHDLFFDLLLVREQFEDWDLKPAKKSWCFQEEPWDGGQPVSQLDLNFSTDPTSSYYVQFRYADTDESYTRFYGKTNPVPHRDLEDGLQVAPKNIIVQIARTSLIDGDEKERLEMNNVGSGPAFYFRGGLMIEGQWEKDSATEPTQFLDEVGGPVCVSPGQTWVAVLDAESLMGLAE